MEETNATPYLIGVIAVPNSEGGTTLEYFPTMSEKIEELMNGPFAHRIAALASDGVPSFNQFPKYLACIAPGPGAALEYIGSNSRAISGLLNERIQALMAEFLAKAPGRTAMDPSSPVGDVFSSPGKIADLPSGAFWCVYSENVSDAV